MSSSVNITLPGSTKNTQPLKECAKCGQMREPTGGVNMTPSKWHCASCWRGFAFRKK